MMYQEPAQWWFDDPVMNDVFVGPKQKAAGLSKASEVLAPHFAKVREVSALAATAAAFTDAPLIACTCKAVHIRQQSMTI
jgi:hypothetical protein